MTGDADDRTMPDKVLVKYRITSTYERELDVARLPFDAPAFDGSHLDRDDWLDDLAEWLEEHPDQVSLDQLHEQEWVDTDPTSVEIDTVEAGPDQ